MLSSASFMPSTVRLPGAMAPDPVVPVQLPIRPEAIRSGDIVVVHVRPEGLRRVMNGHWSVRMLMGWEQALCRLASDILQRTSTRKVVREYNDPGPVPPGILAANHCYISGPGDEYYHAVLPQSTTADLDATDFPDLFSSAWVLRPPAELADAIARVGAETAAKGIPYAFRGVNASLAFTKAMGWEKAAGLIREVKGLLDGRDAPVFCSAFLMKVLQDCGALRLDEHHDSFLPCEVALQLRNLPGWQLLEVDRPSDDFPVGRGVVREYDENDGWPARMVRV